MSKIENTVKNIDLVKEMLNDKRPLFEIARKLGVKYDTLIVHLKKLGIKYEKNQSRKGIRHKEVRKDSYHYLGTDNYITAPRLKEKLIEDGIKEYKCEKCGITEWEGKPAPLELHHINGDHFDNRLENLIILCSNCHAIEHQYCSTLHENLRKSKK